MMGVRVVCARRHHVVLGIVQHTNVLRTHMTHGGLDQLPQHPQYCTCTTCQQSLTFSTVYSVRKEEHTCGPKLPIRINKTEWVPPAKYRTAREGERERKRGGEEERERECVCGCVCVCTRESARARVSVRERARRERERERESARACVCV